MLQFAVVNRRVKALIVLSIEMARKNKNVWNFYENNSNTGIATCKMCRSKLKNNRVSNLKTHLLKQHKIPVNKIINSGNCEIKISSVVSNCSKVIQKKHIRVEISKRQLLRSYIGLFTEDLIPFDVLNTDHMRSIFIPLCDGIQAAEGTQLLLNASNAKKTLQLIAENIRKDIRNELNNKLLSLRIHSATQMCPKTMSISAQFVNDGQICSRTLGILNINDEETLATNENLHKKILQVLENYEINLEQVVSVTCNIDNFCAANNAVSVGNNNVADNVGKSITVYINK